MYEKFERFIFLLFAFDSSALHLDLRKHKLEDLKTIVLEVLQVIERDEEMPSNRKSHMPNLTDLIVRGKPLSNGFSNTFQFRPQCSKIPQNPVRHLAV